MDDMGTPGPNHPAHRGLKTPDNVTNLPGMGMRRLRVFKNSIMDHVLGPEQGESNDHDEEMPPEVAERFKDHLDSLMEKDRTGHLNDGMEDGTPEAKIVSMGKFKEDKANRELMGKHDE